MTHPAPPMGVPRISALHVENFRALHSVTLRHLTPLTVLLGANGSGKSTLFDVFQFLSEAMQFGLKYAWERRGRAKELKTRGATGPIVLRLTYRERENTPLITYSLAVDQGAKGPEVVEEYLEWRRGSQGRPFRFLTFVRGTGEAVSGEEPAENGTREMHSLTSPDLLAVSTLGQFSAHPRVAALRAFITGWYVSTLSVDHARAQPEAGPQERLSKDGDNLANVLQYLSEHQPERMARILTALQKRVPHLEGVEATPMPDGRLLLQIKDRPFTQPVPSKFASEGTLKLLSYFTVLFDPQPPPLIGIEEPENFLHPGLLYDLADECRAASENAQLLVTTHSPYFLNALRPEEVRVLYRDQSGYTHAVRASDIPGIPEQMKYGAQLGHLWMEGHFALGEPRLKESAQSTL